MQANKAVKKKPTVNPLTTALYKPIQDKTSLLCLKPGYTMLPSPSQIFANNFKARNLIIRFVGTEILWKGDIDLRGLKAPLRDLITLEDKSVQVYPNESIKPMAGRELNRKCFATFSRFRSINPNKLRKVCGDNNCEVLMVDQLRKTFTVEIPHFTKYKFNEIEDEDEGQPGKTDKNRRYEHSLQLESNTLIKESNLAAELLQKNAREILRQQQMLRAAAVAPNHIVPVQIARKFLPSRQLVQQIREHNIQNGHEMPYESQAGSAVTIGINCIVSSNIQSCNIHSLVFSPVPEQNRDVLNIVLELSQDFNRVNEYIVDPSVSFQVRRALALYVICFDFNRCKFEFRKSNNGLEIVAMNQAVEGEYYQVPYLKDWFEWVINHDVASFEHTLPQNEVLRTLCLRRAKDLVPKADSFKRKEDREFIVKIEDMSYRTETQSSYLSRQLKAISMGNMEIVARTHWVIKFAFFLWYYSFMEQDQQRVKQILAQSFSKTTKYNLQLHILSIFFSIPYHDNTIAADNKQSLPLWWLISNQNNHRQQEVNRNQVCYRQYRIELLSQLTQMFRDGNFALHFVSREKYLEKEIVIGILKEFIRRNPGEGQRIPITFWREYSNLVHENRAQVHYANKQYFKVLQELAQCSEISRQAETILVQILRKQEMLCGFNRKTVEKTRNLLQSIKTNSISREITFLKIYLGEQKMNKQKILSVLELCADVASSGLQRRMCEVVFKAIVSNPTIIILLKKDKEFYEKVSGVFQDPAYQLELKVARLQL